MSIEYIKYIETEQGNAQIDYTALANLPSIPTKISELVDDSNFLKKIPDEYITEKDLTDKNYADNIIVTEHVDNSEIHVTNEEKQTWNNKSNFSGIYKDLTDKPTIPTKTSQLTNDSNFLTELPNHTHDEYLTEIPSEYITESELNAKQYLTEHQDISGKADKATTLFGYGITDGVTKEELDQVQGQIADLGGGVVADYWQTSLDEAIEKVKEKQDIAGHNCINFVRFSDIHYNARDVNNQYTNELGNLTAHIMKQCNIPLVVDNGDDAESSSAISESYILNDLKEVDGILNVIDSDRLLRIRGNHDDVWGSYTSGDTTIYYVNKIAPSKMWNAMHRKQMQDFRRVTGGDGTYFYVDNIPQKTRFICLNSHFYDGEEITNGTVKKMTTGLGIEQLEWLANVALPVDENIENVLIFTHVPPTAKNINNRTDYLGQYNDGADFRGIITAYCNGSSYTGNISVDYTNKNIGEVVGIFCGHCHVDAIVPDDLPCPIITIRCASNIDYDTDVYPKGTRVLGSDNETALDIVTVDTKNGNIYMTRLGLGVDRVCNYRGEELTTYTITRNLTNCTSNKSDTEVTEGISITETFTPNDGYTLDGATVSITMGGVDISSNYANGVLTIDSVTGNIVITISAVEEETEEPTTNYTNQIPISTDTDGSIFNTTGYQKNARINSSGAVASLTTGTQPAFATGFIPIVNGDIVRFKNCYIDGDGTSAVYGQNASGCNVTVYNSDKSRNTGAVWSDFVEGSTKGGFENMVFDDNGNCIQFTCAVSGAVFMRFTLGGDAENAIITVNEEIS